jgi:quinol-cytochrome oxidoreductase complex cytochrome b subunit
MGLLFLILVLYVLAAWKSYPVPLAEVPEEERSRTRKWCWVAIVIAIVESISLAVNGFQGERHPLWVALLLPIWIWVLVSRLRFLNRLYNPSTDPSV